MMIGLKKRFETDLSLQKCLVRFWRCESGVSTPEFVVMAAFAAFMGVALSNTMGDGARDLVDNNGFVIESGGPNYSVDGSGPTLAYASLDTGEGDGTTGDTNVDYGDADTTYQGDTDPVRTDTGTDQTGGDTTGGTDTADNTDTTTGEGTETAGTEGETTTGEGETTSAEGETTTGEGETTSAEGETTTGEGETTTAEGETTTGEGETTTAEGETTTGEGETSGDEVTETAEVEEPAINPACILPNGKIKNNCS